MRVEAEAEAEEDLEPPGPLKIITKGGTGARKVVDASGGGGGGAVNGGRERKGAAATAAAPAKGKKAAAAQSGVAGGKAAAAEEQAEKPKFGKAAAERAREQLRKQQVGMTGGVLRQSEGLGEDRKRALF
jgi:hypothetical protein